MLLISLWLLVGFGAAQAETPANWSANRPPCNQHSELLKQGHMDLGVPSSYNKPLLAEQFRGAMDSWAQILHLDWHEDDTENCSIQVFDGDRELFQPVVVAARSQLPDRNDSSNATSVMYFLDLEGLEWLDPTDLAALARHHKLRIVTLDKAVKSSSISSQK